jgi:chromatin remodeling complex protein RSC6
MAKKSGAKKGATKRAGSAKTGARKSASKSTARKAPSKASAKKSASKSASKSTVRKSTARAASSSRGGATKRTKRVPNAAFMKPMQPSEELGAVVGAKPIPRTEVTKKIWDYIHKHGLQDDKDRRQINADDRLRAVFGGRRKVSMFEMTRLVNDHLENT